MASINTADKTARQIITPEELAIRKSEILARAPNEPDWALRQAACDGFIDLVQTIEQDYACDLFASSKNGRTAFLWALNKGTKSHFEVAFYLGSRLGTDNIQKQLAACPELPNDVRARVMPGFS